MLIRHVMLIFWLIGCLQAEVARADACLKVLSAPQDGRFRLSLGDRVKLSLTGSASPEKATYLGGLVGKSELRYYFLMNRSGRIAAIGGDSLAVVNGRTRTPLAQASGDLQVVTLLERQQGPLCEFQSLIDCLGSFEQVIHRASPQVFGLVTTAREKGYAPLLKMVNFGLTRKMREGGFWAPLQTGARAAFLKDNGFTVTVSNDTAKLKEHLGAGRPAILDVTVKKGETIQYEVHKDGVREVKVDVLTPCRLGEEGYLGEYNALALTYFKVGILKGMVLIVDPLTGEFQAWDMEDIKAAMSFAGTTATLISLPD